MRSKNAKIFKNHKSLASALSPLQKYEQHTGKVLEPGNDAFILLQKKAAAEFKEAAALDPSKAKQPYQDAKRLCRTCKEKYAQGRSLFCTNCGGYRPPKANYQPRRCQHPSGCTIIVGGDRFCAAHATTPRTVRMCIKGCERQAKCKGQLCRPCAAAAKEQRAPKPAPPKKPSLEDLSEDEDGPF